MSTKCVCLWSIVLLLGGCASDSGVVPMGQGTYMVSHQSGNAFAGAANVKAETLVEANHYCLSHQQEMKVIKTTEAQPPFILGNYPRAEIQFQCLVPNDPRLQQLAPDATVELREHRQFREHRQ